MVNSTLLSKPQCYFRVVFSSTGDLVHEKATENRIRCSVSGIQSTVDIGLSRISSLAFNDQSQISSNIMTPYHLVCACEVFEIFPYHHSPQPETLSSPSFHSVKIHPENWLFLYHWARYDFTDLPSSLEWKPIGPIDLNL